MDSLLAQHSNVPPLERSPARRCTRAHLETEPPRLFRRDVAFDVDTAFLDDERAASCQSRLVAQFAT